MLFGTNANEGTLFTTCPKDLTFDQYPAWAATRYVSLLLWLSRTVAAPVYEAVTVTVAVTAAVAVTDRAEVAGDGEGFGGVARTVPSPPPTPTPSPHQHLQHTHTRTPAQDACKPEVETDV